MIQPFHPASQCCYDAPLGQGTIKPGTAEGNVANEKHVAKLKEGVEAWNVWRGDSPGTRPDLSGADLSGATLSGATLSEADLSEADLSGATLSGATLSEATLNGADLSGANLIRANLSEADLIGADLIGADLSGADLSGATLIRANLSGATLSEANLSEATLIGANLSGADLIEATLSGATLSGATLSGATLNGADLNGADVTAAHSYFTAWVNIDLSQVTGLETVVHEYGPSSVGVDTLEKSKGKIPDVFLRGCGVSEEMIEHYRSILGSRSPIQFYSCFISHSSRDGEFVETLHSRLQKKGLRVWYAPEDLKGGQHVRDQLHEAIKLHDKLLLVLSPASMKSTWVADEVIRARKRERKEKRKVLFPISICPFKALKRWELNDDDTGEDLAREIRRFHVPDFSSWKNHDAFTAAFEKLMDDLRQSGEKA